MHTRCLLLIYSRETIGSAPQPCDRVSASDTSTSIRRQSPDSCLGFLYAEFESTLRGGDIAFETDLDDRETWLVDAVKGALGSWNGAKFRVNSRAYGFGQG